MLICIYYIFSNHKAVQRKCGHMLTMALVKYQKC